MRAVGLVFFLFSIMILSNAFSGGSNSDLLVGFSKNMLAALWLGFISLWVGGILSWALWQISAVKARIRGYFTKEKLENPAWERKMTIVFCTALFCIVGSALVLAALGYHPS